jgi:hypothetical protein
VVRASVSSRGSTTVLFGGSEVSDCPVCTGRVSNTYVASGDQAGYHASVRISFDFCCARPAGPGHSGRLGGLNAVATAGLVGRPALG